MGMKKHKSNPMGRNARIPAERQRQSRSAHPHADRRTKRLTTRKAAVMSALKDWV